MAILPVCHSQRVDIFACAQAGCRDCLEALLRGNEGLIHHILKRQGIGGIEYADLVQEGRIALWHSILHFDPGRGTAFSTYAGRAIYNQFWRCVRAADQSQDYVEVEEWFDLSGQAEAAWQKQQVRHLIREELECLPERLRQVIVWYYGLAGQPALNLGEIGHQLGVSGERIRILRNNALVLLRLPALSLPLRYLCEQDSRAAYRRALSLNWAWQRRSRRRP
jgi:RNA polymerase sigma factor (sigma-70 family)